MQRNPLKLAGAPQSRPAHPQHICLRMRWIFRLLADSPAPRRSRTSEKVAWPRPAYHSQGDSKAIHSPQPPQGQQEVECRPGSTLPKADPRCTSARPALVAGPRMNDPYRSSPNPLPGFGESVKEMFSASDAGSLFRPASQGSAAGRYHLEH